MSAKEFNKLSKEQLESKGMVKKKLKKSTMKGLLE